MTEPFAFDIFLQQAGLGDDDMWASPIPKGVGSGVMVAKSSNSIKVIHGSAFELGKAVNHQSETVLPLVFLKSGTVSHIESADTCLRFGGRSKEAIHNRKINNRLRPQTKIDAVIGACYTFFAN